MFELDKKSFGAFVAQLRREKGWTQKELAQRLFVSDKAVSKWETGASLPDTALLVPLSELLGVSVTELLRCERMSADSELDGEQIESVVKTAIGYSGSKPERALGEKSRWKPAFLLSLLLGGACIALAAYRGRLSTVSPLIYAMCALFGTYFVFFVRLSLPRYYDGERIGAFYDGPVRINLPGAAFNNRNWPHVLRVCRTWLCLTAALYPGTSLLLTELVPELWGTAEPYALLVLLLAGLVLPTYLTAKKYE